jgi:hypothetical protein
MRANLRGEGRQAKQEQRMREQIPKEWMEVKSLNEQRSRALRAAAIRVGGVVSLPLQSGWHVQKVELGPPS